jgi:membrane carboxypeptidase/penicillin-binding protein PbpC
MVNNVIIEENVRDGIRYRIEERMKETGKIYHDEVITYLITGENEAKDNSTKRLILDIQYLLLKAAYLEDMLIDCKRERDNSIQTTIQQGFLDELESVGVK